MLEKIKKNITIGKETYLTDYRKDDKGEYVSLYRKTGNRISDLLFNPDE